MLTHCSQYQKTGSTCHDEFIRELVALCERSLGNIESYFQFPSFLYPRKQCNCQILKGRFIKRQVLSLSCGTVVLLQSWILWHVVHSSIKFWSWRRGITSFHASAQGAGMTIKAKAKKYTLLRHLTLLCLSPRESQRNLETISIPLALQYGKHGVLNPTGLISRNVISYLFGSA